MTSLTPEQANFDHFVGTLENLEKNDQFLHGSGAQAHEALSSAFTIFREARDAGQIPDEEWAKIEDLASDRATAYRVAKGDGGRLAVFDQYQAQTSPQGDTSRDFEDWVSRERSVMESRPDAALYRNDFDYAADVFLTNKIRSEENPDGSSFTWDSLKRVAGGFAGTLAQAVDTEGEYNKNIDRWLATDPARDENFLSEVSQGLGSIGASMATFIAGAGVTKNPLIGGTMASTAFNGMVRYNEGYQQAKAIGAPEAVASKAGLYSTPAAFVDTLGDMFLAGKLGAGVAKSLRLGGATLPRNAILNRFAYNFIEQGTAQAASEVAGDLTAAAGQSVATGNAKIWEDSLARAPRTAAVSFTLGGLLGGASGIKEGSQINEVKRAAQELGVDPMELVKVTKSGQLDITETIKALEQARLDKAQAENPEPPKAPAEPAEGAPPPPPPAPTMGIKTWADAFKTPIGPTVGGQFDLSPTQEKAINDLGAKIDELTEERDKKERAGIPQSDLKRYDEAMHSLIGDMMTIANSKQPVVQESQPDEWVRYAKGGEFRSKEEAQAKASQLAKKSPGFVYQPIKVDPGDGTAFHYELQRRTTRQIPLSGETIARARDIEQAFRDRDEVQRRFDEAIAAVESNQATDVTAETINRLLGIPSSPASFEQIAGPFERGSDAVAARQAMGETRDVVARKENGQWNLYRRTPEQAGVTEQAPDAEESARAIAEQSPIDPFDLIPGDEEFGLEVERQIERKFRNNKRPKGLKSGSALIPGGEDFKQAAKDGAAFFSAGIQKFSEWSEAMIEKWGDSISGSLQEIWNTIKEATWQALGNMANLIESATSNPTDQAYLMAIQKGDMDAAEAEVKRYAKERGYTQGVFHGTVSEKEFPKFRRSQHGIWTAFTEKEAQPAIEDAARVMNLIADPGDNPVKLTDEEYSEWQKSQSPMAWMRNFIGYKWRQNHPGSPPTSVRVGDYALVLLQSSQLKSADVITRDKNGNVIPLSERFDRNSPLILRSGPTPEDLQPLVKLATDALRKAQRILEGAQEKVENAAETGAPTPVADAVRQRNTAVAPAPERVSAKPETAFSQGWRQGIKDMRAGVAGAVEKLSDMLDSSELKSLTTGEYRTISRILSRRNLTTEDGILIEELGEAAIAASKHRERIDTLKKKRKQAKQKLDTDTLGIALVENTHKSPLLGSDTILDVANTDQPVALARAITLLSPSEAAYIQNNEQRPFPGFLDAYEAALDLIIQSNRASQVDVESFQPLVEQVASYNKDVKKLRLRSKLTVLRGAINRAEENNDDVANVNLVYDQAVKDLALANTQLEFDAVNDQISDILGQLEKLPSSVAETQQENEKKLKRRNEAIDRVVKSSNELGRYIKDVKVTPGAINPSQRGLPEPIRSAVYGAFSDVKPSHLENFSTLDIEGIGDVIEQIRKLADVDTQVTAVFNRFSTRMMGNLGALKLWDAHQSEIEAMYAEQLPNAAMTPAAKAGAALRNNPFVRYLTEQQSTKLSELTTDGLTGSFGFLSAQNLLYISDLLKAPGLISTELFGRTDNYRTRGEAKGQALMAPIVESLKKLKDPKSALHQKVRQAFGKRGLDKTSVGIPLVQDLPFQAQNTRALDSMSVVNMALLVRQLDHNNERKAVTDRLNVDDPMIQWIDGGHEKGASPNASALSEEERKRLHDIWDSMVEAAGGNTWNEIKNILTPEQEQVIKRIDDAMKFSGRAVRSTSAVVRNTLLPDIVSYFPLQGSRIAPDNMTDDEVLNARLEPGMAYAPSTLRPSSSHVRKAWTQPQTFDLQGVLLRHLIAVNVDAELTPHLYQTEILMRRLRNYESKIGKPATTKWQALSNGLRREHRRVAGLDVALSSMFMSGGHRALTAIQKLLRRGVLAQVHKPIAEGLSLGWIYGNRIGWEKFHQATRDYNNHKEAFMGLMFDNGSTFMQRTGMNAADMQVIDHGSYRGVQFKPSKSVIEQENPEIRPGVWGWLEETKMSKMSNWATRVLTSYGDHAMSSPAMYSLFMDQFKSMTGKPFSWKEYFDRGYDPKMVREVMLQTDIKFQKLAAPNTSGLVSALRNQSSTSALVRFVKNVLFPYSHFAANEKSNLFQGLRQGFNPNNSRADRKAGFYQAATHAVGNVVYQLAMFNLGKIIVAAAGGAIASALGDGEDDEFARRMKEVSEELMDPENHLRKGVGGLIDSATGSNDPWTRGMIGWAVNQANKTFTEKALARPYDPFEDDVVYVRDIDSAKGLASYLVGPYSRLIEDAFRLKDDTEYLIDPEKTGSGWQRAANVAAIVGGYTVGLPAQTTINKIIKDSSKTYSDEDYKEFDQGLKSQAINNNVKFVVEKQGNTPEAMAMYLRSLQDEKAMLKAIKYYQSYTKERKKTNPAVLNTARSVLEEFRQRQDP